MSRAAVTLFSLLASLAAAQEHTEYRVQCNAQCLHGFADLYQEALANRGPSLAPLASSVQTGILKFVSNISISRRLQEHEH